MSSVRRVLLSRWLLSLIGAAILAVLVWIFGPLLTPLEGWLPRAVIVAAILVIWAIANAVIDYRRRKRDAALTEGLTAAVGDLPDAAAEEVAALRDKLSTALSLLKRARNKRGYLYEQPWYAIIGPPGAGKTTALLNAGLSFPLAAEMGMGAVAGVGGTRMCDWWFTDNAVLIDTAGRYTTQDSDAKVDRAGWEGFLGLLKRTRPRQPLNGTIVAIAVSDVAQASPDERTAHARAIRRRLQEQETQLGIRLPVYALLTKADLIAGFTEFFDDLDREKRDQVWGMTFPDKAGEAGSIAGFAAEWRLLVDALQSRLLDRLQAERSPDRRALIASFPTQMATMEAPLAAFLQEAFGGSKLQPAPWLRGVYLASGTQEGTPIDRLTGSMSRAFGLDRQRLASLKPERGRSYFLGRLLRNVIFGEAMLASAAPGVARRRFLLRAASFAAIALIVAAAALLLVRGRAAGQQQTQEADAALAQYEQVAKGVQLDPVNDGDLPHLVPLLDRARDMAGVTLGDSGAGWLGLSQGAKLRAGGGDIYRHALQYALLPRLAWRLEAQMRGSFTRPDFLYEATRVYLMLGGQGPLDPALVHQWMSLDWRQSYPGATNEALVQDLLRHLDTMLAEPLPALKLDGELVAQARTTFSRVTPAQRVYSRIRPSAAAQNLPPWRPSDALGLAGTRVFERASGKPLTDGIPGFFTVDGFRNALIPALPGAVREVAAESWVLGQEAQIPSTGPQTGTIDRDVIALYAADYIKAWDAMFADLNVVPLRSLPQAAQDLYILSSPQSPMKDLLVSAAKQLSLAAPPAAPAAPAKPGEAAPDRLGNLFPAQPGQIAPPPGAEVDAHFKPLRDLVASGGIDQVLKLLNDLQQQLAKLAAAPIGSGAPPIPAGSDPALALQTEAQRQPSPINRWLLAMASSGSVLRGGGARQQVAAAYNGGGPAALCTAAVNGRFPFTPGATLETPIDDFAKLFAPGGQIDGFFNTQLRPYIDTSGKIWTAHPADGVPAPVRPEDVAQFQRAAQIRDLFFAGGTTLSVRFDITPTDLDNGAKQVMLDLDGTTITYAHGPTRPTAITWPGANRMQTVRLVFDPPPASGTGVITETGPWAMFRLFGRGKLEQEGSPEKYRLTFQLNERQASFEIRANSVMNPFAPGLLQDFKCPAVQ